MNYATALDAASNSATLARQQYRSGLIDYPSLLITENLAITARDGLSQAQYDQAAARVQLYAALGGGWDADSPANAGSLARQDK